VPLPQLALTLFCGTIALCKILRCFYCSKHNSENNCFANPDLFQSYHGAISRKRVVWITAIALSAVCYVIEHMKKEHPKPFMVRLYKSERRIVSKRARLLKVSEAEIIRRAICLYLT
jgi:hypothetical protein